MPGVLHHPRTMSSNYQEHGHYQQSHMEEIRMFPEAGFPSVSFPSSGFPDEIPNKFGMPENNYPVSGINGYSSNDLKSAPYGMPDNLYPEVPNRIITITSFPGMPQRTYPGIDEINAKLKPKKFTVESQESGVSSKKHTKKAKDKEQPVIGSSVSETNIKSASYSPRGGTVQSPEVVVNSARPTNRTGDTENIHNMALEKPSDASQTIDLVSDSNSDTYLKSSTGFANTLKSKYGTTSITSKNDVENSRPNVVTVEKFPISTGPPGNTNGEYPELSYPTEVMSSHFPNSTLAPANAIIQDGFPNTPYPNNDMTTELYPSNEFPHAHFPVHNVHDFSSGFPDNKFPEVNYPGNNTHGASSALSYIK